MTDATWGVDEGPGSFGSATWAWDPVHSDRPEDLPEVAAASALGFHPAPEAPLWCFIPAIWPSRHRAWVRDCRVRSMLRTHDGHQSERVPWTTAQYAEIEDDTNRALAALGLPPRPAGRVWLLRPPDPYVSVDAVLDEVWSGWVDGPLTHSPQFVEYVGNRLRATFGACG